MVRFCRMRRLQHALLTSCKNRIQLSSFNIVCSYDMSQGFKTCFKILRHFSYTIISELYNVGLIYMTQFACDKIVPSKSALKVINFNLTELSGYVKWLIFVKTIKLNSVSYLFLTTTSSAWVRRLKDLIVSGRTKSWCKIKFSKEHFCKMYQNL